ncbi:hypothetical protein GGF31_003282 [Allomyces arbusculus]|nr:hypothetical protein GGF31_003282 [Allomyces arbusculus]
MDKKFEVVEELLKGIVTALDINKGVPTDMVEVTNMALVDMQGTVNKIGLSV